MRQACQAVLSSAGDDEVPAAGGKFPGARSAKARTGAGYQYDLIHRHLLKKNQGLHYCGPGLPACQDDPPGPGGEYATDRADKFEEDWRPKEQPDLLPRSQKERDPQIAATHSSGQAAGSSPRNRRSGTADQKRHSVRSGPLPGLDSGRGYWPQKDWAWSD